MFPTSIDIELVIYVLEMSDRLQGLTCEDLKNNNIKYFKYIIYSKNNIYFILVIIFLKVQNSMT